MRTEIIELKININTKKRHLTNHARYAVVTLRLCLLPTPLYAFSKNRSALTSQVSMDFYSIRGALKVYFLTVIETVAYHNHDHYLN